MRGKMPNVTWGTVGLAQTDQFAYHRLAGGAGALYNPRVTAHWCSWLTRCPLKAEITGSSPVCAAKRFWKAQKSRARCSLGFFVEGLDYDATI